MFGGLALIAALSIGLGLLVTHVIETGAIGAADERVNVWLAAHRTPTWTDASLIGSIIAGGVVLPIVAGVLALAAALFRKWRLAAFFVFALAVESATYRATTLVVHSHRPRVHRLESLPVNASYPSGHTAAAIAVYCGLALLITSRFKNRRSSRRGLAARRRDGRVRRDGAHVPRHAPPPRRRRRSRRRDRRAVRPRPRLPFGGSGGGMKVAVIAHAGKSLGGGLPELRRVLEAEGIADPFWVEVPKSKKAPAQVQRALDEGAELVFAWGGDGMVQRCVDVLAGSGARLAIIPAGTANLFASNLGIPQDIEEAVAIGLRGDRRELDVGRFNGERFAVMAGAGFDAAMIRDSGDGGLKERFGRAAYVWSGSENLRSKPFRATIEVDGAEWYKGKATCILLGNVGKLFGGVEAFEDARPDDGKLEVGVVTADGVLDWSRMIARAVAGSVARLAIRADDEGARRQGQALAEGSLRARRGRPDEGEVVQGQGRAAGDHRLRPINQKGSA